ncbi:hypothetical protein SDC9_161433 [bioreactor metagenome]|uniref:Uncharacterized protein n=1 Tax=bioreactor metagenome TaxID=1076179 RepID=A0A645FIB7_9ZZZZ
MRNPDSQNERGNHMGETRNKNQPERLVLRLADRQGMDQPVQPAEQDIFGHPVGDGGNDQQNSEHKCAVSTGMFGQQSPKSGGIFFHKRTDSLYFLAISGRFLYYYNAATTIFPAFRKRIPPHPSGAGTEPLC